MAGRDLPYDLVNSCGYHASVLVSSILDVILPTPAGRSLTLALCNSLWLMLGRRVAEVPSLTHCLEQSSLLITPPALYQKPYIKPMNFENHIRDYFQLNDCLEWSVLEVLRYISDNAIKLLENLPRKLRRKDLLKFLENQDLKFAEGRYKVNVELSVVTDKTAMTGKTTEKFVRVRTQTTVNNEQNKQEENEGGDVVADESSTMCVKDILEDSIQVSSVIKEVTKIFLSQYPKTSIMDLLFDEIDNYITDDIHEYLTSFFNEYFTAQGWDNAINNMDFNRCDSENLKNIKKLIQETLPKFLKAFSLGDLNPLRDITILEKPHLNQFVHPIIDSALWNFAKVNYIFGEIPLKGLGTRIRADGVGFLNDVINYPIVCGEGTRPGAPQKKSVDDDIKNASSMAVLYNNIVIEEADVRRQLFKDLRVYGLTAFKTELSLTMMDFRSVHRLFEVDHFCLPKNWVDMPNFVWLYEAIVKWAERLTLLYLFHRICLEMHIIRGATKYPACPTCKTGIEIFREETALASGECGLTAYLFPNLANVIIDDNGELEIMRNMGLIEEDSATAEKIKPAISHIGNEKGTNNLVQVNTTDQTDTNDTIVQDQSTSKWSYITDSQSRTSRQVSPKISREQDKFQELLQVIYTYQREPTETNNNEEIEGSISHGLARLYQKAMKAG
ncbi:10052_t:CDS:10 [Acaulospora morrowiae]|uniref:10052_t:CDS:1 n=1 Tax=Acaulospora morrowiae TaxID=94023 RepID=A0A9N9BRX7_9GLOM|nr:10052_t:CDS:10 [Acaulospora morrowiae]